MKFVKFGDGWIQMEAVAQVSLNHDSPDRHVVRFVSGDKETYPADDCKELIAAIEASNPPPAAPKSRHLSPKG